MPERDLELAGAGTGKGRGTGAEEEKRLAVEQELIIIGAGKFARETVWMLERLARQGDRTWKLWAMWTIRRKNRGASVYGLPVLGTVDALLSWPRDVWAIMPMGTCGGRRTLAQASGTGAASALGDNSGRQCGNGKNFEIGEEACYVKIRFAQWM